MSSDSETPPPGGLVLLYQTQEGKHEKRVLVRMPTDKESLSVQRESKRPNS